MARNKSKERKQRWIVTTKVADHLETNFFYGSFEKMMKDVLYFCGAYDQEVVAIMKDM